MTIGRRIAKNLARVKMNVATKMHAIDFESLFSATQSHSIGAMHQKWLFKSVNFLSKSLICQKIKHEIILIQFENIAYNLFRWNKPHINYVFINSVGKVTITKKSSMKIFTFTYMQMWWNIVKIVVCISSIICDSCTTNKCQRTDNKNAS